MSCFAETLTMNHADTAHRLPTSVRTSFQQYNEHARRQQETLHHARRQQETLQHALQTNDSKPSEAALQGTDLERGLGQAIAGLIGECSK